MMMGVMLKLLCVLGGDEYRVYLSVVVFYGLVVVCFFLNRF